MITHALAASVLAIMMTSYVSPEARDLQNRYKYARWTVPPASEYGPVYPKRAAEENISGGATVECLIATTGKMKKCDIVSETPPGYLFGQSAQYLFKKYASVDPATVIGGIKEGDHCRFSTDWTMETGEPE